MPLFCCLKAKRVSRKKLVLIVSLLVKSLPDGGSSLLPLECLYLNRTALVATVGHQPPLPKHFTLRRKPKSAALRAELTQKGICRCCVFLFL